jgi:glucokinase
MREAVRPTREPVLRALRDAVTAVGPGPVVAVGLSCAGPVDAVAGTVSPINIPSWRDFPLRERIAELVSGVPVALAGDGQCMALGEHWLGAGRGVTAMLGMVVSTGVGGGLVLDGRPFAGRSGNAGHIGHVITDPAGDPCTCGARGCVETVASGPSLVRWARENGYPGAATAQELGAAASHGETVARQAFQRGAHALALGIVAAAALCDLEVAVVGGGVAQAGDVLFEPLRRTVAEHAGLSYLADLRVVPATLGTGAGLAGAAALAFQTS